MHKFKLTIAALIALVLISIINYANLYDEYNSMIHKVATASTATVSELHDNFKNRIQSISNEELSKEYEDAINRLAEKLENENSDTYNDYSLLIELENELNRRAGHAQ